MAMTEKRKIQVQIDQPVAIKAEKIMQQLGITPSVAVNALYSRIVATGGLPFPLQLTKDEQVAERLHAATERAIAEGRIESSSLKTPEEIKSWLEEE